MVGERRRLIVVMVILTGAKISKLCPAVSPPLVFANKVLLEHSYTHLFMHFLWLFAHDCGITEPLRRDVFTTFYLF